MQPQSWDHLPDYEKWINSDAQLQQYEKSINLGDNTVVGHLCHNEKHINQATTTVKGLPETLCEMNQTRFDHSRGIARGTVRNKSTQVLPQLWVHLGHLFSWTNTSKILYHSVLSLNIKFLIVQTILYLIFRLQVFNFEPHPPFIHNFWVCIHLQLDYSCRPRTSRYVKRPSFDLIDTLFLSSVPWVSFFSLHQSFYLSIYLSLSLSLFSSFTLFAHEFVRLFVQISVMFEIDRNDDESFNWNIKNAAAISSLQLFLLSL